MTAASRESTNEYCNTLIAADIVFPGEMALPTVRPARGIVTAALTTADVAAKTSGEVTRPAAHRREATTASSRLAMVACAASSVMPAKFGTAFATIAGGGVSDLRTPEWCPAPEVRAGWGSTST
ncbi:hypothetical protein [Lentzea albida]|uniref:Uncharacterized protein n=1 Tax=Lentzea albida TaxID=65499 RepID=A0A1H9MGN9_9PSEU|nr:hypothetical protein [Lentzea albida]SER22595.1 hypothetical protein SAMN04488000_10719 [Lentzea albida]